MADAPTPAAGDVVLSYTRCGSHPHCYKISVLPRPAQLCVPDRAQAVEYAMRYAAQTHVDVWVIVSPDTRTRLTHGRTLAAAV
jgi:hypothetical protein